MSTETRMRPIRSYVLREGRLTKGQQRALDELWPRFGIELPAAGAGIPDYDRVFGRRAPLHLEIGFGDGGSLAEMAARYPQNDYIGVEVHRPGVGRLLLQLEERGLTNVRVFRVDAIDVLKRAIGDDSLAAIYLFFPDPWHKKKHHKRRIVNASFISLVHDRLQAQGRFHFASDWEPYAVEALERLEACGGFRNAAGAGVFSPRPEYRPLTRFERRGERLGHEVWDIVIYRQGAGVTHT